MQSVMKGTSTLLVLPSLLLCACEADDLSPEELKAAISAVNAEFMTAVKMGDAEAVAQLYTEDGELRPPGSAPVTGRAAISEFWGAVMGGGVADAKLMVDEVGGGDDWAYEVSRYAMYDSEGGSVGEGSYIVIWQHTPDGWRLHRDIWN